MINNISYEQLLAIIEILTKSNNNLKIIFEHYKDDIKTGTVRMQRFTQEIDNYINYLKNSYEINKDADLALSKLKDLNTEKESISSLFIHIF